MSGASRCHCRTERGLVELQVLAVRGWRTRPRARGARASRGTVHVAALRCQGRELARRSTRNRGVRVLHWVMTARSITSSRSCVSGSASTRLAGVGHRVVHGGSRVRPTGPRRCGRCSRRSRNTFRSRRCTSRTTWRLSGRCSSGAAASADRLLRHRVPPGAAAGRTGVRAAPRRSPIGVSSATVSTGSRTSTSRRSSRSTTRAPPRARSSCCISATARACARSRRDAASPARWDSPPPMGSRWAPAAATSTRAWCCI